MKLHNTILSTACLVFAAQAQAQSLVKSYDFSDGTTTFFADTTQIGDAIWKANGKHGQLAPSIVTGGLNPGFGDLAGSRVWASNGYLQNGSTGEASFDMMTDSDFAYTVGDRVGFSFMDNTEDLFIGFEVSAFTSPNVTWNLVAIDGTGTMVLDTLGPFDSSNDVWFDLALAYSVSGGVMSVSHTINGFFANETLNLPHATLGSFATISGNNNLTLDAIYGSGDDTSFGLTAKSAAVIGTSNNSVDNLQMNLSVPEPSGMLLLLTSGLLFFRRKR